MYVIFIRCDKRTSNNNNKKQSQNDVRYKAAKPKKTIKIISLFHMTDKKIKHNTVTRSIAKVDFATFLKVDFMLS